VRFSSRLQHHRQIPILQQFLEKSSEYGKYFFACFVDLEKSRFFEINFAVNMALIVSCCLPLSFFTANWKSARVNSKQSKPFLVDIGLRQAYILSPILFIIYMN